MTGTVVGYDPGGNRKHGFARAEIRDGKIVKLVTTTTLKTTEEVVREILGEEKPLGLGIDTLTCWSTGPSGLRPADRWLRRQYPDEQKRVIAPGGLRGAMCLNGMAVLAAVRQAFPDIFVTETHPKVLYYALSCGQHHDYSGANKSNMDRWLRGRLDGVDVTLEDEHQWDAAISILPVVRALSGSWQRDLHDPDHPDHAPINSSERLMHPCGKTTYMWPEVNSVPPTPVPRPRSATSG